MAAAALFCNPPHGYVNKLHHYIQRRDSSINRSYEGSPLLYSIQRPLTTHQLYSFNGTKMVRLNSAQVNNGTVLPFAPEDEDGGTNSEEETDGQVSRATLIWRAIKLPMYSVALVPLTVGSAAAYYHTGVFYVKRYLLLIFASALVTAWVNLSNDVYDFDTGADKNKKESVVNLYGSRTGILVAAYVLLALSGIALITVAVEARSLRAVLLSCYAVICGYIYQCPPFRLGYWGLGEPLCFAAFGPFATTIFYLLQCNARNPPVTGAAVSSSILVGISSSLILLCSHFHQIEDDRAVGKYSPLVRLGSKAGSEVVKVAVVTLYSLVFLFGLSQALPFSCSVSCALTIPMGRLLVNFVENNHEDKLRIFMGKYYCVRLNAAFGVALAAGMVGGRLLAGS